MKRKLATALSVLAITVGLLLVGWGVDDLLGFFAHPARLSYVALLLVAEATAVAFAPVVNPLRKGKVATGRWALAFTTFIGFALVWFLPFGDRRELLTISDADWLRYLGLGLCLGGGSLRLAGLMRLGKQFSGYVTVQEDHQLIQSGIYAYIRHPMYLGFLLGISGLSLVFRSWLVIPVIVVSTAFILLRIRHEEQLLAGHFGSEFEAYRKHTWRLLPHIY